MRTWLLAVTCCAWSCSCPRSTTPDASTWPDFPGSGAARTALISEWTHRPITERPEVTPERVFAEAERVGWSTLPSGDAQIRAWLGQHLAGNSWLLFGTFHDSAGQVEAFRRLVGPGGVGFTHVVLEQFRADGRWRALDGGQAGDSTLLTSGRWDALARAHEEHDYTAWKYGYAEGLLDVVTTARALRIPALGCDLPDSLLAQATALSPRSDDEVMRLRELHCLLSVREAITQPNARVAMLWGQAHVRVEGFRRFLPPGDRVLSVYALGARHSEDAPDELLRDRLILNDPVLVPLGEDEAALVLPDAWLGGQLERVRTKGEAQNAIRVSATVAGTFEVGTQSVELGPDETRVLVAAGAHTFSFKSGGLRVIGSVLVPERGEVELTLDVPARSTRMVEIGPTFP